MAEDDAGSSDGGGGGPVSGAIWPEAAPPPPAAAPAADASLVTEPRLDNGAPDAVSLPGSAQPGALAAGDDEDPAAIRARYEFRDVFEFMAGITPDRVVNTAGFAAKDLLTDSWTRAAEAVREGLKGVVSGEARPRGAAGPLPPAPSDLSRSR